MGLLDEVLSMSGVGGGAQSSQHATAMGAIVDYINTPQVGGISGLRLVTAGARKAVEVFAVGARAKAHGEACVFFRDLVFMRTLKEFEKIGQVLLDVIFQLLPTRKPILAGDA